MLKLINVGCVYEGRVLNKKNNMNSTINELKRLKKLIGEGSLDTAFDAFASLLNTIDTYKEQKQGFENMYLVLSSEKKNIDNIKSLGTADSGELRQLYARLTHAFLGLINTVESLVLSTSDSDTTEIVMKRTDNTLNFWNNQNKIKLEHFRQNYSNLFQGFPIVSKPNNSEKAILDVYNTLLSRKTLQGCWMDKADDDSFNLLHVNTSVLYFFLQLGLDLTHSECKKAVNYIDTIKEISIDNRAKWYFDIQTDRISSPNALEFITLLEREQIIKGNAIGAFLFEHGNQKVQQAGPIHYGGYSLHACLIADTLLHISPKHTIARRKASDILKNIEAFLTKMAKENDGYLLPSFRRYFCNGLIINKLRELFYEKTDNLHFIKY
jgi:hypothetical protein